jgi:hypothetical protein
MSDYIQSTHDVPTTEGISIREKNPMTVANLTKVADKMTCPDCEEQSDIPRNEQNYNTIRCQCGLVLFDAVRARSVEPGQGGGR